MRSGRATLELHPLKVVVGKFLNEATKCCVPGRRVTNSFWPGHHRGVLSRIVTLLYLAVPGLMPLVRQLGYKAVDHKGLGD